MERGDGLNPFHNQSKSSSGLSIKEIGGSSSGKGPAAPAPPANSNSDNPKNTIAANANGNAATNASPPAAADQPCLVREQDQYMPIANVTRIMRRILPPHAKISDDAKVTIQDCVSEFISFVTGEANERCQREQRKTVTAEDVLWAMGKLGFDDYVGPLALYLNRYRESENERTWLLPEPVPKRPADYESSMILGHYVAAPPPAPTYHHMGQSHGRVFLQGIYEAPPPPPPRSMASGFLRDSPAGGASGSGAGAGAGSAADAGAGAGASSSQPSLTKFDPFSRFK